MIEYKHKLNKIYKYYILCFLFYVFIKRNSYLVNKNLQKLILLYLMHALNKLLSYLYHKFYYYFSTVIS